METNGALRGERTIQVLDDGSSIATLTAELEVLVDQLASDLADSRPVTAATASRIHQLREQAEQLFAS